MCGQRLNEPFTYTTEAGRTYTSENADDMSVLQKAFGSVYKPDRGFAGSSTVYRSSGNPGSSVFWKYAGRGNVASMNFINTINSLSGENPYWLDDNIAQVLGDMNSTEPVGQTETLSTTGEVGAVSNDMPTMVVGNRENTVTSGAGTSVGEISRRPALSGALRRRANTLG